MKRFIYNGIYYPVLGRSVGWCNHKTKCVLHRRFGGWANAEKWWSFNYGIHVKIFNTEKPYKKFVIDAIKNHPELKIVKNYFNDYGYCNKEKSNGFIYEVHTNDNHYIGSIKDAYYLTPLTELTNCTGWHEKEQKAYGWSHRAKVGFSIGDKIFEEEFGDDSTPFIEHGYRTIMSKDDAKESAFAFAKSVS